MKKGMFNYFVNNSKPFLNKRNVLNFIRHYGGGGGHNLDEKRGELGYALFHYSMITNIRPKKVLCVGSMKGFIPAICALACKDTNQGHVDFVDAGYDQSHSSHWGGIGFWKQADPIKHFSYSDLSNWITTFVMTSEQFAHKYPNRTYKYIYIDGDHSFKGVKLDYRLFWSKLRDGGFMVFHDVLLKKHPDHKNFGVWQFWNKLKKQYRITLPFTYSRKLPSGLGIMQKVS